MTAKGMTELDARLAADPSRRYTMTRRFDVPCERVFDAWTDPKIAGTWLFCGGPTSEKSTCEIDLRPGGAWKITDTRDGVLYTAIGEYIEIDRPRRVVFSFGMPQFSDEFGRLIVELAPDGEGCRMNFTSEGDDETDAEATRQGYTWMFMGLAQRLGAKMED